MDYVWDHHVPLKAVEVFVNTIEGIMAVAQHPWDAFVPAGSIDCTLRSFSSQLVAGSYRRSELKFKHIISALYLTGNAMASATTSDQLIATILMNDRAIGFVRYELKELSLEDVPVNSTFLVDGSYSTKDASTSLSRQSPTSLFNSTGGLSFPRSGTVKDYSDPKFAIDYEFQGPKIPKARMFTAFVDGVATAAQHGNGETGARLVAFSADRAVSIVIRRDVERATFSWGRVKTALRVIWREIVIGYLREESPIWEDFIFSIYYDGERIGEGYIVTFTGPTTNPIVAITK